MVVDLYLLGLLAAALAGFVSLGCLAAARWALCARPVESRGLPDDLPSAGPA